MRIADFITFDRVRAEMQAHTKPEALAELAGLVSDGSDPALRERLVQALRERERLATTGIGEGIAIPHGKCDGLDGLVVGLGRSSAGVEFESIDGRPVRLFFVLAAPQKATGMHLKALARISRLCKAEGFRERLLAAPGAREMLEIVCGEDSAFRAH